MKAGWFTNTLLRDLLPELRFVAPHFRSAEVLTLQVDSTLAVLTNFRSLWYDANVTFDIGK